MKKYYLLIALLTLIIGAYVALLALVPKPINWQQTFANKDKIPYGTRAVFELLPDVFPKQKIEVIRQPIYNMVNEVWNTPPIEVGANESDTTVTMEQKGKMIQNTNLLMIAPQIEADSLEIGSLLEYVSAGNEAFIATNSFPKLLLDTLHVRIKDRDLTRYAALDSVHKKTENQEVASPIDYALVAGDTIKLNFLNTRLAKPKCYHVLRQTGENYFVTNDTTRAVGLGINQYGEYNFLKIPFGQGFFYLHSVPEAFSNYFLLRKPNDAYTFAALSYLKNQPLYWDEYQKQGRIGENSPLRFIESQEALKWAWYLLLGGLLLYLIFMAKRRQRVIPIINPPKNTSLEFVQTIGSLYFQQQNHNNIAQKKITHLLAYIRQRFHLKTNELNQEFKEALIQKSGLSADEVHQLLKVVERTQRFGVVSEYQLIELSNRIEAFYREG